MLKNRGLANFLLRFQQIRHFALLWHGTLLVELVCIAIEASLKVFLDLFVPLQFFDRLLCNDLIPHVLSQPSEGGLQHQQAREVGEFQHCLQAFLALVLAVDIAVSYQVLD